MAHLFLVHIGPVQSFIISARRTRDLWFGSELLSDLARTAAAAIQHKHELASLIFPAPAKEESLLPGTQLKVTNKLLALIEGSPEETGEVVRNAIYGRLHEISSWAYRHIGAVVDTTAEKQIEDLIEYFWVALPFSESRYADTRHQLDALMAARKNTRNFQKVQWGGRQPKSSIDGQLESVIPEHLYPRKNMSNVKRANAIEYLYRTYRAGPAEHLSGVDLLKRHGLFQAPSVPAEQNEAVFLSTSHIAAIPYLQRLTVLDDLEQREARRLWDIYIGQVSTIADAEGARSGSGAAQVLEHIPSRYEKDPVLDNYDGALFFKERLLEVVVNKGNFNLAQKALQDFFHYVDKQIGKTALPDTYYAILQADGDRMGEVIDHQAKQGYAAHQELSRTLDRFAGGVQEIVSRHQGALIYAGGDDVLAFVPLHTILDCAYALSESFSSILQPFEIEKGKGPTLSVGVAIVHHLSLLQDALNVARDAEARAKRVRGKNALAIVASKRSGEDYTVAGNWDNIDRYLKLLVGYFRAGHLPKGMAYELRAMSQRLTELIDDQDEETIKQIKTIIRLDAGRIIQRKLEVPEGKRERRGNSETKAILQMLKARLANNHEEIDRAQAAADTADDSSAQTAANGIQAVEIDEFINELIVAQILADAMELAEPKKG